MLVLTRKSGEKLRIGNNIIITAISSSGGRMKLGITAPPDIPIHREEVYNIIQEENKASLVSYELEPDTMNELLSKLK